MKIVLENRIRLKEIPDILKELLIQKLCIPNPKFLEAQNAGRSIYRINQWITNFIILPDESMLIPRGLRPWIMDQCQKLNIDVEVTDKRTRFEPVTLDSSNIKYRPYQFDAMVKLTAGAPEGILIAPPGSGKTVMGLSLILLTGQPTLWLTHTGPLAEQAISRAQKFLPDTGNIGLIGRNKWKQGDILTIALVQTLIRNLEKLNEMRNNFGLVISDECHHVPSRTFSEVICSLNPYYLYGLTATPYRRDKLEQLIFQSISTTTVEISTKEVEKYGGILLPEVKYKEIRSQKIVHNDIILIIDKHIVNNDKRNNIIVNDVVKEAKMGHFGIVIADRRDHCEILYKKISKFWPKTGIATGKYSKKYIQKQVDSFENGKITILVATFSLLGEGFDVPFLDRAFVASPFRARVKTEQLIGRIQRYHHAKKDAVVYDYVDIDIGVLKNQFFSKSNSSRYNTYKGLGLNIKQIQE